MIVDNVSRQLTKISLEVRKNHVFSTEYMRFIQRVLIGGKWCLEGNTIGKIKSFGRLRIFLYVTREIFPLEHGKVSDILISFTFTFHLRVLNESEYCGV